MNEKDSLWRRVVRSKYGANGLGWYPSKLSGAYGQSLWRFMLKGWGRFYHHFSLEAGVGSFFFGTIVGVRRLLYEISSPLFMCLL